MTISLTMFTTITIRNSSHNLDLPPSTQILKFLKLNLVYHKQADRA